jgi:hypothetical protein
MFWRLGVCATRMLSSYVGSAIGAVLIIEYGRRVLYVEMQVNGCDMYGESSMVCKGSCGCILPRDARQHMMQRLLVMRADEPRPRGKLALTATKKPVPSPSESKEESLHLSA